MMANTRTDVPTRKMALALILLLMAVSEAACAVSSTTHSDAGPALERYRDAFARTRPDTAPPSPSDGDYRLFANVLHLVLRAYVTPPDPQRLVDKAVEGVTAKRLLSPHADDRALTVSAINAMLRSLDPYSRFLDVENLRAFREQMQGDFAGIGIEIIADQKTGFLRVVTLNENTPAARAGVRSGDLIAAINGRGAKGLSPLEAVTSMHGPTGGTVDLQVLHPDDTAPLRVSVTRSVVHFPPVVSWLDRDIAYVRIVYFGERTTHLLRDALDSLRRDAGGTLSGLVLDLRDNPGGLFVEGVEVADQFLEAADIVATHGRESGAQRYRGRGDGDVMPGVPIVVLIDGGSSSASEIVAGALQDHHRALLFGARSYGKGSVQTIYLLPGGEGLRLTTAHYVRPSGAQVDCFGILPNLEFTPAERPLPPGQTFIPEEDARPAFTACASQDQAPPPPETLRMLALCPEIARLLPDPRVDGPLECAFSAIRGRRIGVEVQ